MQLVTMELVGIKVIIDGQKIKVIIHRVGDIIFFDWKDNNGEQDGSSDHTGIVEYYDIKGHKVHTIEGNTTGDDCDRNVYNVFDTQIMGYGILNRINPE